MNLSTWLKLKKGNKMEKEIMNLLNHFNINIDDLDVKFVMGKDKVYICSNELAELEFKGIQRKGMLAFKMNTLYGTKPSLDFVLCYGHLANKNTIIFEEKEIIQMYEKKEIIKEVDCEDGLVIIKNENEKGIGLVFKKENVLKPLISKNRLIR